MKTEATDSNYSMQDKNGQELLQVSTPVSPVKSFDISKEFGSWIGAPFPNSYKTYSKDLKGFFIDFSHFLFPLGTSLLLYHCSVNLVVREAQC